jgi:hypothetical protein
LFLTSQAKKLLDFARPVAPDDVRLEPRPWRERAHPSYYLIHALRNNDGVGGYSRSHDFDDAGIPCLRLGLRQRYDPLVVARYAMQMLHIGKAADDPAISMKGLRMLPFLVASGRGTGAWGRGDDPGRMSSSSPMCITQGVVISALLRLSKGRPQGEVVDLIERAYRSMTTTIERGGTLSMLSGGPFFEEYPSTPPSHVLNGCLYALFGLYDLADALGDERASRLSSRIEETLSRTIGQFTTRGGWSHYALNLFGRPYLASMHYHRQHIRLCGVVAGRTGDPRLSRACETWRSSLESPLNRWGMAASKTAQVIWMRNVRRHPLGDA